MSTFVNAGKNVFRDPNDPELPNLDAGQIEAPETRDVVNGCPVDELQKEAPAERPKSSAALRNVIIEIPPKSVK